METIILGILILTFISYIWHIVKNYGILPSISESYYRLPDKQKKLFTFFCWGFAFPTIIIGNSFFLFLAGAGIAFVGAAAAFKSKMTNTVHTISAIFAIAMSQLSIYFDLHMVYLNIIFVVLTLLIYSFKKIIKNHVFWIEIVAFGTICYALSTLVM